MGIGRNRFGADDEDDAGDDRGRINVVDSGMKCLFYHLTLRGKGGKGRGRMGNKEKVRPRELHAAHAH